MPIEQLANLTLPQRDRIAFVALRVRFIGEILRQDYDAKGKTYVLGDDFKSIFDFSPERVLSWLTKGFGDGEPIRLKTRVASESPSSPQPAGPRIPTPLNNQI